MGGAGDGLAVAAVMGKKALARMRLRLVGRSMIMMQKAAQSNKLWREVQNQLMGPDDGDGELEGAENHSAVARVARSGDGTGPDKKNPMYWLEVLQVGPDWRDLDLLIAYVINCGAAWVEDFELLGGVDMLTAMLHEAHQKPPHSKSQLDWHFHASLVRLLRQLMNSSEAIANIFYTEEQVGLRTLI